MMKIFDWATFFYLSLKMLSYTMMEAEETSEVVMILTIDAMLDVVAVPLLAKLRTATAEDRRNHILLFFYLGVSPVTGQRFVYSCDRLWESRPPKEMTSEQLAWLYWITLTLIGVKLVLWKYCRNSGNAAVRMFAKEHSGATDLLGLVSAILGSNVYWWIDPVGAILVVGCMMMKWHRRLHKRNPDHRRQVGDPAPPEFIRQLNHMASNHHRLILNVNNIHAYTIIDNQYYVSVQFELPEEIPVEAACQIEDSLQRKIQDLSEVRLAIVLSSQGRVHMI